MKELERLKQKVKLEKELTSEDYISIQSLLHDENYEIRYELADLLGNISFEFADQILMQLLTDTDELVRTNACNAFQSRNTLNTIKTMINVYENDASNLVKMHAILTICDVVNCCDKENMHCLQNYVLQKSKFEKDDFVKVALYKLITIIGLDCTDDLICMLILPNYQLRSFIVRTLGDIIKTQTTNKTKIKKALERISVVETSAALKALIQNTLTTL